MAVFTLVTFMLSKLRVDLERERRRGREGKGNCNGSVYTCYIYAK